MVRRFYKNCDVCGKSHLWRKKRKGFLKPLSVPDRFYIELSIDFITNLPAKGEKDPRFLMVITNRLLKSCTLETITFIRAHNYRPPSPLTNIGSSSISCYLITGSSPDNDRHPIPDQYPITELSEFSETSFI
jgi:hypothetical protein